MLRIVILCLALFRSPPAAIAAPVMMGTDRLTDDRYFRFWPQRSSPPAKVATSTLMTNDGPTKKQDFQLSSQRSTPPATVTTATKMTNDGQTKNQNFQLWPQRSSPPAAVDASTLITTYGPAKNQDFQLSPQRSSPSAIVTSATKMTKDGPTKKQNFQLWPTRSSPPAMVTAVTLMTNDGPAKNKNFQLWPQRSSPPATVAALKMMVTDGPIENFRPSSLHNCHCGHRAEVTTSDPAVDQDLTRGHYHVHSTEVTKPDPATVYTRANCHHDFATAVTDAERCRCPHHHYQPQESAPNSTPSPAVYNIVTEEIPTNNQNYDESEKDYVDDDYYSLNNFVLTISLMMFVLLYPSCYMYSNRRPKTNSFYLQTNTCGCKAKYIRCSK
ncbi:unnamed protein product [Macrosiphum euphorbiae]|uniref:Uncharacterized protein n=1 Tax=Macrosiphum euphorbiae TaxID=13131 RepID=A0AAV0VT69_9HEMI|nr:unnamed protein product [Macrosiphum euphorbiae]